jgi:hypothetical protein
MFLNLVITIKIFTMKKITLLFFLLTISLGYSQQVLIQNFETPSSYAFEGFEGLGNASIVSDPASGGTRLNSLQLVSASTGQTYQGAVVNLLTSKIKLTTDKTIKIDVYATKAFTLLAKVEGGGAGPNSAASQNYTTPNAWQTLTFTYTQALDGTATANGEYSKIVFFPNWKATNDGFDTPINFTLNIDNIVAEKGTVVAPSSAVIIQDFEALSSYTFEGFEGLGGASIVSDPASGGTRLKGLQLVSVSTGQTYQGAVVNLLDGKIKLRTDKTVKIDVYATKAFTLLAKVEGGGAGPNSAASQNYTTPNAWQTLTFTYTQGLDGTANADGEYSKIVFFPNWKVTNDGFGTPTNFTLNIDNIFAEKAVVVADPAPTVASPKPKNYTTHLALLADITDTGAFTNFWNPSYYFGENQGTPDLDSTTGVNKAIKMNLNTGWGGGINTAAAGDVTTDASANDMVHIDYYVPSNVPAGAQGHQFYLDLISRDGAVNKEAFYGVGTTVGGADSNSIDKVIVFDSWQSLDIPLSAFMAKGFNPATFFQFKLGASSDIRTKLVYFDNIFFYKASTLGVKNFSLSNINMYPNPVSDEVTIEAKKLIQKVAVFNLLGQEVLSLSPKTNSAKIQTSSLSKGVYVITATIDDVVSSSKFIKF